MNECNAEIIELLIGIKSALIMISVAVFVIIGMIIIDGFIK